ncbi:PIG-L deacetylase family protein, partial [Candidatus Hydrogenedentota bacterium]
LDTIAQSEIIAKMRDAIAAIRPEIVYVVHNGDVHSDHRIAHESAMAVLKSFYMRELGVRRILAYETLSSTDAAAQDPTSIFVPQIHNDISSYLERKLEIMKMFGSELQEGALPRTPSAISALARVRGATVGFEYAETFMLLREID